MLLERAARPGQLLADVRRPQRHVLPDAHRRSDGHATTGVHLRRRHRLGDLQPDLDDRRLRAVRRRADLHRQLPLQPQARSSPPAPTRGAPTRWSGRSRRRRSTTASRSSRSCAAGIRCGTRTICTPAIRTSCAFLRGLARWPLTWRAAIVTGINDGEPEEVIRVSGPSIWPFAAACGDGPVLHRRDAPLHPHARRHGGADHRVRHPLEPARAGADQRRPRRKRSSASTASRCASTVVAGWPCGAWGCRSSSLPSPGRR